MLLKFSKMQALGNDFVVIDAVNQSVTITSREIQYLANRNKGVGCDQVLLLKKSHDSSCDFFYQIFNADGGEAEQCLNGARCMALFVHRHNLIAKPQIEFETINGSISVSHHPNQQPTVILKAPTLEAIPQFLHHPNLGDICFYPVSVGNPHAVILVNDIKQAPVSVVGAWLSNHEAFHPGVNVGFLQIIDKQTLQLRVFERGVGETLACGSGAAAAFALADTLHLSAPEVTVAQTGGNVTVAWQSPGQTLTLTGPAHHVFDGEMDW